MKFRLCIVFVAALMLVSFGTETPAQIFGTGITIRLPYRGHHHQGGYSHYPGVYAPGAYAPGAYAPFLGGWHAGPRRAPTHAEKVRYMNYQFPKYYGGFHANQFQNEGWPPGDIGLRGNGVFPNPW